MLQGRLAATQAGDSNATLLRERINELEALLKTAESSRREKEKMISTRLTEVERKVFNIRSYFSWKTGGVALVVLLVWPFVAFEVWSRVRDMGGFVGLFSAQHIRLLGKSEKKAVT